MGFQGYSPETFDFLWGLRFNNNRAWFAEHKKDYVNYLYEPTKELGADLFSTFENIPGLGYRVSRIYKDVRFSKGDPYKESLWISIRRSADSWDAESTLYFEIRPEDCHYGLVFWRPESGLMQAFREDIAARPEVLDMILSCEREAGCLLEGDPYVRTLLQPEGFLCLGAQGTRRSAVFTGTCAGSRPDAQGAHADQRVFPEADDQLPAVIGFCRIKCSGRKKFTISKVLRMRYNV